MMKITSNSDQGAVITPLIIATVTFLAVVAVGYYVFSKVNAKAVNTTGSSQQAKPATSINTNNLYAILKPATVPSKTAECSQPLSYNSNGDPSPITCNNGELNVLDWQAMAALEPKVMKLGYSPTVAQVEAAICLDGNAANADSNVYITGPLEANVYQISSLYYGWHFSINPINLLDNGC